MKAIGGALEAPLKFLGLIPRIPKPAPPMQPVTRDNARDAAATQDELLTRKGSLADIVTGANGAEAGATGRTRLG